MSYVKLMADYASSGLWSASGLMMDSDELPVSSELKERILQWQIWYEHSQYYLRPEERTLDFNLEKFAKVGEELAKEIKIELPHWTVMYWNEEYCDMFDPKTDQDIYLYEIRL